MLSVYNNSSDAATELMNDPVIVSTGQENGEESFEELQQLFEDMFQADIGLDGGPSLASSDSSTSSAYMTYSESSSSNKRNSSEMNFGKAENSSVFDASYQNFCFGVGHVNYH
ncbi:hypothetical protein GLYMA_06G268400v4 [Glycine max]|nr:hypothetical protein GLYMA_06G268400v4 [Glycine max]